jgi:hypothetical protein
LISVLLLTAVLAITKYLDSVGMFVPEKPLAQATALQQFLVMFHPHSRTEQLLLQDQRRQKFNCFIELWPISLGI